MSLKKNPFAEHPEVFSVTKLFDPSKGLNVAVGSVIVEASSIAAFLKSIVQSNGDFVEIRSLGKRIDDREISLPGFYFQAILVDKKAQSSCVVVRSRSGKEALSKILELTAEQEVTLIDLICFESPITRNAIISYP